MSQAIAIQGRVDAFVSDVIGRGPMAETFDDALRRRRAIADDAAQVALGSASGSRLQGGDDWIKRRGGGGGGGEGGHLPGSRPGHSSAAGRVARAFAGERGQAAVIKIKSYASGAERVKATARYVAATAEQTAEKDSGERLVGAAAINAVLDTWERDYFATDQRRETSDTASLTVKVDGQTDAAAASAALIEALPGHRYAFALAERGGQTRIDLVTTLQSDRTITYRAKPTLDQPQGAERTTKARLRPTDKAMGELASAIGQALGREATLAKAAFHHGEPETLKALARLAQGGERPVTNNSGAVLRSQDERLALAQGWRRFMASRQTRDTMHLIVSSRPGTDRTAFIAATRVWLKDTFGRHEYLFTVHENTAHTHVHALIVMRTRDRYERMRTSPAVLLSWRERFAERARGQGIAMFAERRLAKGQQRPMGWRQGERAEQAKTAHVPERASEAGLMATAQAEWIATLRTIETSYQTEPGGKAAAAYARGVVARLEAGLAAWRSQSRYNDNDERMVERRREGGATGGATPLSATLASIDGLVRKVEDGMVTEAQARTALRDTHGRIMKLAVMSRSAETRARFTAIANDIYERGNAAVTAAVDRRREEIERDRAPLNASERNAEHERRTGAEQREDERRRQEQDRMNMAVDRRKDRERERE